MLFLSYVPLLTDRHGLFRPENEKESLISMLTEAANSYRIESVVWVERNNLPYPVLVANHALEICEHMVEWAGGKPDNYFTLIWQSNKQGYDLALMPNMEKSARRAQQLDSTSEEISSILGHVFLFQATSGFNPEILRDRLRICLGWATNTSLEEYCETTVRLRAFSQLSEADQALIKWYWSMPIKADQTSSER